MIQFTHFNFNVLDLEKSLNFYRDALHLTPVRQLEGPNGAFRLVYLGDGKSDFTLELTWLKERSQPYHLGECEFHLAFETDDYEGLYQMHKNLGIIAFENAEMGIYFITDPDGYWIEILPKP